MKEIDFGDFGREDEDFGNEWGENWDSEREEWEKYQQEIWKEAQKEAQKLPIDVRAVAFTSKSSGRVCQERYDNQGKVLQTCRRRLRKPRDVVLVLYESGSRQRAFMLRPGAGGDQGRLNDLARECFPNLPDEEAMWKLLESLGLEPDRFL